MNSTSANKTVFYFSALFRMDEDEPTNETILSYLISTEFKRDFPTLHVFDVKQSNARGVSTINTHPTMSRSDFYDAIKFIRAQDMDKEFQEFCEKYNPKYRELCIYNGKTDTYSILYMGCWNKKATREELIREHMMEQMQSCL